jgi:iron complex outermembrane receptor protein
MFFATIARGYLGPTVAFSGLTGTRTNVNPQTVRDITVGFKSQLFNRAVTFNASAFFDKYTNLQTSVFNGTEFLTENAGGFEAKGFEFDARWRVSPEFSLNGGLTYSDTKFTDYVTACPKVVKAGLSCYTQNGTSLLQAAGEPLSGAPKVSFTFGRTSSCRSMTVWPSTGRATSIIAARFSMTWATPFRTSRAITRSV